MPDWDQVQAYIRDVFGAQDATLAGLMPRAIAAGLPAIAVDASVGRLLKTLCAMTNGGRGAALALELGTLAGYSAIWISRGLRRDPPGRLITLEPETTHADFAERALAEAGAAGRVQVR
ncbi:MAG: class I SAM-dependent methyltransferase, partial [Phycisphaerales bacterium]|nr:class I SAM-dependent methyltransferase [Phycisphaerales bacterium]